MATNNETFAQLERAIFTSARMVTQARTLLQAEHERAERLAAQVADLSAELAIVRERVQELIGVLGRIRDIANSSTIGNCIGDIAAIGDQADEALGDENEQEDPEHDWETEAHEATYINYDAD